MVAMQRQSPLIAGALVFACVVTGGSVWWYRAIQARKSEEAARASREAARKAAAAAIPHGEIRLQGLVSVKETVQIAASTDGQLLRFHVDAGDEVYQGQLLAEIGNTTLAAAQETATAELERAQERVNALEGTISASRLEASRAQANNERLTNELERATRVYNRQKFLLSEGATPRKIFEKAEAEYKTLQTDHATAEDVAKRAEARLSSLQTDLDNAKKALNRKNDDLEAAKARVDAGQVVSPVNGVVVSRRGTAGDPVNPAIPDLFRIAPDLSHMTVTVEAPQAVLKQLAPGQQVAVNVADLPADALPGTIASIDNGKVIVEFGNPSSLIRPGATATVRLTLR